MEKNTIEAVSEINTANGQAYASDNTETEITSGSAQTEKTFTQKELDDIVRSRLERAKKDLPSKEELQAFREWQNDRASAEQEAAEKLSAAAIAKEAAERDRQVLELRVACLSRGVSPEYADDVLALAERYSDGNTSFEEALDSVIAKYPAFCRSISQNTAPGITTGVRTQAVQDNNSGATSFIDIVKENQAKRN